MAGSAPSSTRYEVTILVASFPPPAYRRTAGPAGTTTPLSQALADDGTGMTTAYNGMMFNAR